MKIKLFVFKLLLFCSPLVLGWIVVEWKLAGIPNSYNQKRVYLERSLDSIQVLVLGNSEALYAINPSFFSYKGFNLANISQSLYYDKRLALKYIDQMPQLKLVVIPVSYTSFFHQLSDTKENWRDYYYYRFWGIKYDELPIVDSKCFSYVSLYTMPEVLKMMKKGFKVNLAANLYYNGFMKNDTLNSSKNISDNSGKARVELHDSSMVNERIPEIVNDLSGFLAELQKRKIQFVLITTPVYTTYSKYCNPLVLENNRKIIDSLCRKFDCTYHSFFADNRFTAKDFADNDHMNFLGAERFSGILNDEVIVPLFNAK